MKPTANYVFDNRTTKKNGTIPIKLSIYYSGRKKLYGIGHSLTKEQWEKLNSDKLRDDYLRAKRKELSNVKSKAEKIIDNITSFSFEAFEKKFFASPVETNSDVFSLFERVIKELNLRKE